MQDAFSNSFCQMCWPHVIMTYKTNITLPSINLISHVMVNQGISSSNDRLWELHCTLYTSPYVPLPTLWMSSKSCWGFLLWISPLGRGKISMVAWTRRSFTFSEWNLVVVVVAWWSEGLNKLITVAQTVLLRAPCPDKRHKRSCGRKVLRKPLCNVMKKSIMVT